MYQSSETRYSDFLEPFFRFFSYIPLCIIIIIIIIIIFENKNENVSGVSGKKIEQLENKNLYRHCLLFHLNDLELSTSIFVVCEDEHT
jgi:hypothetical protein